MGVCENTYAKNTINMYESNLHRGDADIHYNLEDNLLQHRYKLTYFGSKSSKG